MKVLGIREEKLFLVWDNRIKSLIPGPTARVFAFLVFIIFKNLIFPSRPEIKDC